MMTPMELGDKHPIRKSKKQKQAFREDVRLFAQENGYAYSEEKCSFGGKNLLLGDPEKAEYLVTAHYDTCARMIVPNLITPCSPVLYLAYQFAVIAVLVVAAIAFGVGCSLAFRNVELGSGMGGLAYWLLLVLLIFGPANKHNRNDNTSGVVTALEMARTFPENQRHKVCFVLFDLEEAGLIGSGSYRKAHKKASETQLVLNLDCVGDGNTLMMFPTRKLKKDKAKMAALKGVCGSFGHKVLSLRERGFSVYPSDQKNFPYGVGICALHHGKLGLYLGRIHTHKDTVLEETNVNILRSALTTLITRGEKA